jgi:hypothetical protein
MYITCKRGVQRGDSIGNCPIFIKKLVMGQSMWLFQGGKKKVMSNGPVHTRDFFKDFVM